MLSLQTSFNAKQNIYSLTRSVKGILLILSVNTGLLCAYDRQVRPLVLNLYFRRSVYLPLLSQLLISTFAAWSARSKASAILDNFRHFLRMLVRSSQSFAHSISCWHPLLPTLGKGQCTWSVIYSSRRTWSSISHYVCFDSNWHSFIIIYFQIEHLHSHYQLNPCVLHFYYYFCISFV